MRKLLSVAAILMLAACAHTQTPVAAKMDRPCPMKCKECHDCAKCTCPCKEKADKPKMEKCPMHHQ